MSYAGLMLIFTDHFCSSPLPDRRDKWLGKRRRLAPRRRKYKWRSVLLHLLLPALLVVEELTEPANGWEQYHQKNQRRPSQYSFHIMLV